MAKVKAKQALATFLKGILAGMCIALGGALSLVVTNIAGKFVGGMVFAFGMVLILNLGYFLYTGKVCFLLNHLHKGPNLHYALQLLIGIVGNLLGALLIGSILSYVFEEVDLVNKITNGEETLNTILEFGQKVAKGKIENDLTKVFILAVLCNILIYFCVEGFAKVENPFVKHLIVFLTIGGFVILGFEHSIADMFYICFARAYSIDALCFMLVVIAGNTVGGLIIPSIVKVIEFLEKR